MRLVIASVLVGGALLAGCSNTKRCEGEQAYQTAETLPTPGAIPGLTVPDSPSALHIPPQPAQPVPFGVKVADAKGGTHYECLDVPPHMVAPAESPATSEEVAPKQATEAGKS
ncbi:hypothetical protein [Solimonas terrae]|uniref:Lipoprotein n=1 Tax=Solimonas terrae TaxID=1396819 RepID=A0A6M2BN34_9GAMM|nr:hypothetical protein [Solimonas terrae]NGY03575.1 hypothetical protein [Solimonas terrae]